MSSDIIQTSASKEVSSGNTGPTLTTRLDSALDTFMKRMKQIGTFLKISPSTSPLPNSSRKKRKCRRGLRNKALEAFFVQVEAKRIMSVPHEWMKEGIGSESPQRKRSTWAVEGRVVITPDIFLFKSAKYQSAVSSTDSQTFLNLNLPLKTIKEIFVRQHLSESGEEVRSSNGKPEIPLPLVEEGPVHSTLEESLKSATSTNETKNHSLGESLTLVFQQHSTSCDEYHLEIFVGDVHYLCSRDEESFLFCLGSKELDEVVASLRFCGIEASLNVPSFEKSVKSDLRRQETCIWEVLEICNDVENGAEECNNYNDHVMMDDIMENEDESLADEEEEEFAWDSDYDSSVFIHGKTTQIGSVRTNSCSELNTPLEMMDFSGMKHYRLRHCSMSNINAAPACRIRNYSFRYNEEDYPDSSPPEEEKDLLKIKEVLKQIEEEGYVPQFIGDVTSDILTQSMVAELSPYFSPSVHGYDMTIVYATNHHGFSLRSVYRQMRSISTPCLLLIEDDCQRKFGAFLSKPIKMSTHFYGDHTCFVFRWHPNLEVYRATSKNHYFMKGNLNSFVVGSNSGFNAIWVEEGLLYGHSYYSDTFDNPVLCSNNSGAFTIKNLEIWTFDYAPYLEIGKN